MRLDHISLPRTLVLLVMLGLGLACTRVQPVDAPGLESLEPRTQLTIESKVAYAPGEALLVEVRLQNATDRRIEVTLPSHETMTFSYYPRRDEGYRELREVEPVYSPDEPLGQRIVIEPGESVSRPFLFTVLTLDRGEFLFQAIYLEPQPDRPGGFVRVYSNPIPFVVQGEEVAWHRTVDGLLARREAVELAAAEAGYEEYEADALLADDAAGFKKWWINVWRTKDPEATLRSYLIDPYRGGIWGEAREPFERADPSEAMPPAGPMRRAFLERRGNAGAE